MKFESASGMSNDALEALAEKLYGTQDKLEEHAPADSDLDAIVDDLYEGQFAAVCVECGIWHDPDILDPDDICEACLDDMEDDDEDYDDDFDLPYGFSEVDLDDEDDIDEEDWLDADLDGIDDFDWEDEDD